MSEVMRFLSKAKDILLLKEQRSIWTCYRLFLKPCRNLFGYLDKFYVVQTNQLPLMKKGIGAASRRAQAFRGGDVRELAV